MSLTFHRKPIKFSANTLETLVAKYQVYTEEIKPTGDDSTKYEEYCTAINLIIGGIKIIRSCQENLQNLVDKLEKAYEEAKTKGNKKVLVNEIEEIDQQYQFSEKIAKANEIVFILEARSNEYRDRVLKLASKLGIDQHKSMITHTVDKQKGNSSQNAADPEIAQWLSDDASDSSRDREDVACRTLKPKQLNLPRFYGDEEEFPEYWAVFERRAETAIEGIQLIPQNYKWITEELKKKFGNKPTNRAKIVQKLIDMRAANNSAANCAAFYDKIRMLINQMVSAGQDIRAIQDALWTEKILEKFPHNIVKSVLISIQNRDNVTIGDVMQEVEKEITAKQFVESRSKSRSNSEENKKKEYQPKEGFMQSFKSCVFCSQTNHLSTNCRTITDPLARRNVVRDKKLCWKCLSANHSSFECSWANCPQCGQQHNKSLFISGTVPPQKRDTNRNNRPYAGYKMTSQQLAADNRPHKEPWRNQQSDGRHNSNQANIHRSKGEMSEMEQCIEEHMHRRKKQIVLMTAVGNIWNYKSQKFEQLLFFFDTGAQRTIISEEISHRFGLPTNRTEVCTMSGLGGHIEKFQSNFVTLKVSDAYGQESELQVHTKPVITNSFPSAKLTDSDKEFLKANEIQLCNPRVRGEHQTPHILVRLDYYFNLVIDHNKSTSHLAYASRRPCLDQQYMVMEPLVAVMSQIHASNTV
uniref:Peptidase A2 domain-containing protein n=1 Tax=Haemonchus contortus TaxID=6289 RepID=A0A7I4Z127_HAECO